MKKLSIAIAVLACLSIIRTASAQTPTPTINGTPPPFVFNGAGVSQVGQTFTFAGSGTNACTVANGCVLYNGTTATTQAANDNSTKVATTAYVASPGAIAPSSEIVSGLVQIGTQVGGAQIVPLVVTGTIAGYANTGSPDTPVTEFLGQGYTGGGSNYGGMQVRTDPTLWYKGALAFRVANADASNPVNVPTERMRITAAGDVLIGTTTDCGSSLCTSTAAFTGAVGLGAGSTATTQSTGDNSTKVGTTAYTDLAVSNAIAGVNPAVAVLAASTANITGTYVQVGGGIGDTFTVTATGAFSLDGISLSTIGQRVLFKNQSTASQNGVYMVTVPGSVAVSPVFTRALDYDIPSDVNNTGAIPVQSGTANTTTSWLLTSQVTSIGSAGSSLTYAQFSYAPSTICTSASCPAIAPTSVTPSGPVYTAAEYSNGTCTTSKTITPVNGNRQSMTLTNGDACALTFTQPTGTSTASISLKIIQSAVSTYNGTITGCKWPGGVVPTITATTGAVDFISVYLDGTNAYCVSSQNFQ